jgi:hypothetical protein
MCLSLAYTGSPVLIEHALYTRPSPYQILARPGPRPGSDRSRAPRSGSTRGPLPAAVEATPTLTYEHSSGRSSRDDPSGRFRKSGRRRRIRSRLLLSAARGCSPNPSQLAIPALLLSARSGYSAELLPRAEIGGLLTEIEAALHHRRLQAVRNAIRYLGAQTKILVGCLRTPVASYVAGSATTAVALDLGRRPERSLPDSVSVRLWPLAVPIGRDELVDGHLLWMMVISCG